MLPPEVSVLFEGPSYGHVASLMADGSPHSVAVWVGLEGEHVVFFTQSTSLKARNLARDPRVAISMVKHDNPYHTGRIRGRVARTETGEEIWEVIDRMAVRYTGQPFPMRPPTSVLYYVEPEKTGSMVLPFEHRPSSAA